MRVFLTGAAGFVGSHVLRHLLTHTDAEIICPVTFRHRGTSARLRGALYGTPGGLARTRVLHMDLRAPIDAVSRAQIGSVDYILNVASESHVDRSLADPGPFIRNNTDLMLSVLDYAREIRPKMVLQMSTDEVYGPAHGEQRHVEWDAIRPSNPYSASKAAQEAICFAYWRAYDVPVVITNTMNIIGETQDREKFVPKTIRAIRDRLPVPVHVAPDGTPGSRFYLHARNLADAWLHLIRTHTPHRHPEHAEPSRFHIVGEREVFNTEMVSLIADAMGEDYTVDSVDFHGARPGHDLRYALDGSKIAGTGWTAPVKFEESLSRTVRWTLDNPEWLA